MHLRALILSLTLSLALAAPGTAQQTREQTLADIRQELTILFVEVQRLRAQLSTTGTPNTAVSGNSALERLDAIEQEMRRLTAMTETLELRVERVVSDGTNKIGDLEFRLCELESACDIGSLGDTPRLGGDAAATPLPAPVPAPSPGGEQFAVGEQGDFDRAQAQFDAGEYAAAAEALERFVQNYPGGPLTLQAFLLRGDALGQLGEWQPAARAYLDSFTLAPNGPAAPGALLKLGEALGRLQQTGEACLTLTEVGVRFPGVPEVAQADAARATLGCS
jgi:tol-pal system protein YbgF